MKHQYFTRAGLCLALVALVAACDESSPGVASEGGTQSIGKRYVQARAALEGGKYEKANRAYLRLIEDAGDLAPRLRLELAHSYLRGGNLSAAAEEARRLSEAQDGTARSAALAVLGTAEHEMGLAALEAGDKRAAAGHLQRADAALAEVLKNDKDLDPLGALAGRRASIAVQLKALG
jgi:tetratricopeptide (TPR) repeat protein